MVDKLIALYFQVLYHLYRIDGALMAFCRMVGSGCIGAAMREIIQENGYPIGMITQDDDEKGREYSLFSPIKGRVKNDQIDLPIDDYFYMDCVIRLHDDKLKGVVCYD